MGLVLGGDLQECGDITWRVSDCEELVGLISGDDESDLSMSLIVSRCI